MEFWDAKEKISRLSLEELEARDEAREDYKKWVGLEEIMWRQKSREVWLKEGDRNTDFFHKMVNAHRRRNNVDRIKINGAWLTEENGIREGGLGVKCLSFLNKTLLAKWNWRFANEREALWNQVIRRKYGEEREVGVLKK